MHAAPDTGRKSWKRGAETGSSNDLFVNRHKLAVFAETDTDASFCGSPGMPQQPKRMLPRRGVSPSTDTGRFPSSPKMKPSPGVISPL